MKKKKYSEFEACGKVKYQTKRLADKAIPKILATWSIKPEIFESYCCEICGYWHHSSMSPENLIAVKHREKERNSCKPNSISIKKRLEYLQSKPKLKKKR